MPEPTPSAAAVASELVTDWCVVYDAGTDESGLLPGALNDLEQRITRALDAERAKVWEEIRRELVARLGREYIYRPLPSPLDLLLQWGDDTFRAAEVRR